jgi:U6 snRNA-associated Sm-like protein LSm1
MSDALVEDLDKRVLVYLRDGRFFVGYLRSFDQYANLALEDTFERVVVNNEAFADVPCGLQVFRGENVVLFGQVDADQGEMEFFKRLRRVTGEEIRRMEQAAAEDRAAARRRDRLEWPVFDDGAL